MIVEPVFGQVKEVRGFRRFSFRGLQKNEAEWSLICLTHNLLKLFRRGAGLATSLSASAGALLSRFWQSGGTLFAPRINLPGPAIILVKFGQNVTNRELQRIVA